MPNVLKLDAGRQARFHRQGGVFTFQRLDGGHFIGTDDVFSLFSQAGSLVIYGTYCLHLLLKNNGVIRISIQPIFYPMWVQVGFILKNALRFAVK